MESQVNFPETLELKKVSSYHDTLHSSDPTRYNPVVHAYVTAENAFGVPIRMTFSARYDTYTCTIFTTPIIAEGWLFD
jgi:hypothetical protein